MKKMMSVVFALLLVVCLVAVPATPVSAKCTCPCCTGKSTPAKKSKSNKFTKSMKAALKQVKSAEKDWLITTKQAKKTKKKLYTNVHFENKQNSYYMDVQIRTTKTKGGKIVSEWWFKQAKTGQWKLTNAKLILQVLNS